MTAVKDILEAISVVIPFLERYPGWVKAIVGAWLVLTLVMVDLFHFCSSTQPWRRLAQGSVGRATSA